MVPKYFVVKKQGGIRKYIYSSYYKVICLNFTPTFNSFPVYIENTSIKLDKKIPPNLVNKLFIVTNPRKSSHHLVTSKIWVFLMGNNIC